MKRNINMDIKGKKINFLGDSITEGHGASSPQTRFASLMESEYGAIARNYGIGGTRIAKQRQVSENPIWDLDFCSRALEMDPDADIVVVFGGTNDFGHGLAPLGTFADRDPYTFYGACHTLALSLIERYPDALIVFMTPLHRASEDIAPALPEKGQRLSVYVDAIKEVAAYYALPLLDLFSLSGIQPRVDSIKARICPDGLHPNDKGHKLIAQRLAGFLQTL